MAKARQCDRCGKFFSINDDSILLYWHDIIEDHVAEKDRHEKDLCFKCAREFKDWLKNEDKEVKND